MLLTDLLLLRSNPLSVFNDVAAAKTLTIIDRGCELFNTMIDLYIKSNLLSIFKNKK